MEEQKRTIFPTICKLGKKVRVTRPASLSRCSRAVVVRGTAGTEKKHIEIIGSLQVAMELFLGYTKNYFLPSCLADMVSYSF